MMYACGVRARLWPGMAGAVLAVSALPLAVCAQQVVPATQDPGRLRERFDVAPVPESTATPVDRRDVQDPPLPDALRLLRVTLKAVQIESTTVLPGGVLQAHADSYTGREISGGDILALASALTAMYRSAGYMLSLVVIPPQTLAGGVLTLRVVEGYVDKVKVQTGPGVGAGIALKLAAIGEKIRDSRPLLADVLERYLLIANDFPGIELRSVLTPSQAPAAADLTLLATLKAVEGFAALDNHGSKYLGPGQASVGVTANQLLGVNDQWRLMAVDTGNSEMSYGQLSYSQVLTVEGLKFAATLSQARTQPGDILLPFNVRGRGDTTSLVLSTPWLRTRNNSVIARATYDHANISTEILGTRVIEDRLRVLRLGMSWRLLDRLDGQSVLDLEFSQGLGGTQASDLLKSRSGAKGVFNKLTFDYERVQHFSSSMSLALGLGGQWANTPLLSSEQYALGGRRFGRAYEPAELVGERALAVRIEPRYAAALDLPGVRSYQLFGFYDIGQVWKVGSPTPGQPVRQSLASAGVGSRFFLQKNLVASLEAVLPLTKPLASERSQPRDFRLLGSLLLRF